MKKLLTISIILFSVTISDSLACNTCGCGVGSYHYGILPQFQKNFLGLRYRYRSYNSHLEESHHGITHTHETFQSAELWGRFYPSRRLQAFVFVPYNMNHRDEGHHILKLKGLGDIVVSANYNLINTYDSLNPAIKQNLLIGGGIKLPTGRYRAIKDGQTINQNFQLGTGSVDYLASLIYTVRYKRFGINTEFTHNFNTTNKDDYQFGDISRASLSSLFVINTQPGITLMPHAGIQGELYRDNEQYGQPFEDTSGWAVLYNAGLEIYYKNAGMGLLFSQPVKQELFSGHVQSNERLSLHLTYMF